MWRSTVNATCSVQTIQLTKFPIIFKNYLVIYVYLVISCTIKCQKKTQKLYHLVPIFL